jgi:hypothetical protein
LAEIVVGPVPAPVAEIAMAARIPPVTCAETYGIIAFLSQSKISIAVVTATANDKQITGNDAP